MEILFYDKNRSLNPFCNPLEITIHPTEALSTNKTTHLKQMEGFGHQKQQNQF